MSGTKRQTETSTASKAPDTAPTPRTSADGEAGRSIDNASGAAQAAAQEIDSATDLRISIAVRYYGARARFFNNWAKASVIVSAVGGSAAFGAIIGGLTYLAPFAALAVALVSLTDLAVGFNRSADRAEVTFKQYRDLESAIRLRQIDPSTIVTRLHEIEKTEPSTLDALYVHFHNIECEYRHQYDDVFPIGRFQRFFAHFFTLPPNTFRTLAEPSASGSGGDRARPGSES